MPTLTTYEVSPVRDVTVHLVRHGQSEWNRDGRLQGQIAHIPLTPLGREQAAAAAGTLQRRARGCVKVWSSDLIRAQQTADIIAQTLGVEANFDAALREQSLGIYEGRMKHDLVVQELVKDLHGNQARCSDGESVRDVFVRVSAFFARILPSIQDEVVIVSHGDTIRVAQGVVHGREYREVPAHVPPNGSVTSMRLPRFELLKHAARGRLAAYEA